MTARLWGDLRRRFRGSCTRLPECKHRNAGLAPHGIPLPARPGSAVAFLQLCCAAGFGRGAHEPRRGTRTARLRWNSPALRPTTSSSICSYPFAGLSLVRRLRAQNPGWLRRRAATW